MERRAFLGAAAALAALPASVEAAEERGRVSRDEDDVPDPVTTPVDGAFASMHMADDNARAEIDVLPDEVWDGQESTRVAYTQVSIGAFRFSIHLEDDDARAVAHDLLAAVSEDD